MRAFVGIFLPEDVSTRLGEIAASLPVGRAVSEDHMHVTLAFLDEQTPEALGEFHDALAAMQLPAPEVAVERLDVFGGTAPRVLFAEVRMSEALAELRRKVRSAARAAGITLPHERFRPHVTLRRFRRLDAHELAAFDHFMARYANTSTGSFRPARVDLVESQLTPDGPVYETLASYPLTP